MFIEVTGHDGSAALVNLDNVKCIAPYGKHTQIMYTDGSVGECNEPYDEIKIALHNASCQSS